MEKAEKRGSYSELTRCKYLAQRIMLLLLQVLSASALPIDFSNMKSMGAHGAITGGVMGMAFGSQAGGVKSVEIGTLGTLFGASAFGSMGLMKDVISAKKKSSEEKNAKAGLDEEKTSPIAWQTSEPTSDNINEPVAEPLPLASIEPTDQTQTNELQISNDSLPVDSSPIITIPSTPK